MQDPDRRFVGRVLLVEDNAINRLVATEMLARLRVPFDCASDGVEALERLAAQAYDLVLMDCLMPRLDGYAATERWRDQEALEGRARTPIVALTANASADDRQRCADSGMDDFIGKPLRLAQLASIVARYVRAA
jgi:CheY-like chemotaxis protein